MRNPIHTVVGDNDFLEFRSVQDGKTIGYAVLDISGKKLATIEKILVDESVRRKGVGTELYMAMYECAKSLGKKLASDWSRSESAENWWAKQYRAGKAKHIVTPSGGTYYIME